MQCLTQREKEEKASLRILHRQFRYLHKSGGLLLPSTSVLCAKTDTTRTLPVIVQLLCTSVLKNNEGNFRLVIIIRMSQVTQEYDFGVPAKRMRSRSSSGAPTTYYVPRGAKYRAPLGSSIVRRFLRQCVRMCAVLLVALLRASGRA